MSGVIRGIGLTPKTYPLIFPGELPGEAVAGRQPGDNEREQGSERQIQ